jgi:rhodanese-related sulfurtransferase
MNLPQEEWAKGYQNNNSVILDVRTDDEYNSEKIPNAINIDIYKGQGFVYLIEELDKSKDYYVYCRSGARSENACRIMRQLGFEKTFNLVGGILSWQGAVE